jgi:ATP adenylyltransferase
MSKDSVVDENELAYAVRDAFPATLLHTLGIPKRHVGGYFELGRPELNACHRLLEQERQAIERRESRVDGVQRRGKRG